MIRSSLNESRSYCHWIWYWSWNLLAMGFFSVRNSFFILNFYLGRVKRLPFTGKWLGTYSMWCCRYLGRAAGCACVHKETNDASLSVTIGPSRLCTVDLLPYSILFLCVVEQSSSQRREGGHAVSTLLLLLSLSPSVASINNGFLHTSSSKRERIVISCYQVVTVMMKMENFLKLQLGRVVSHSKVDM